jgi:hypothetical protein
LQTQTPVSKEALLHIREDITCGLHSGFPPCCIKWYITKWIWNLDTKLFDKHWGKIRGVKGIDISYIPCPKCLKNKTFVKLKKCPKSCPKKKRVKAWIKALKKK